MYFFVCVPSYDSILYRAIFNVDCHTLTALILVPICWFHNASAHLGIHSLNVENFHSLIFVMIYIYISSFFSLYFRLAENTFPQINAHTNTHTHKEIRLLRQTNELNRKLCMYLCAFECDLMQQITNNACASKYLGLFQVLICGNLLSDFIRSRKFCIKWSDKQTLSFLHFGWYIFVVISFLVHGFEYVLLPHFMSIFCVWASERNGANCFNGNVKFHEK